MEKVLKDYAYKQVNLASESARNDLARAIIRELAFEDGYKKRAKIREDWMKAMERKRKSMEEKLLNRKR